MGRLRRLSGAEVCDILGGQGFAKVMEAGGLSQTRVADMTGVDQPTVSKLLGGSLTSVTVDRLLTMLNRLGHNVTITVDDEPVSRVGDACVLVTFR